MELKQSILAATLLATFLTADASAGFFGRDIQEIRNIGYNANAVLEASPIQIKDYVGFEVDKLKDENLKKEINALAALISVRRIESKIASGSTFDEALAGNALGIDVFEKNNEDSLIKYSDDVLKKPFAATITRQEFLYMAEANGLFGMGNYNASSYRLLDLAFELKGYGTDKQKINALLKANSAYYLPYLVNKGKFSSLSQGSNGMSFEFIGYHYGNISKTDPYHYFGAYWRDGAASIPELLKKRMKSNLADYKVNVADYVVDEGQKEKFADYCMVKPVKCTKENANFAFVYSAVNQLPVVKCYANGNINQFELLQTYKCKDVTDTAVATYDKILHSLAAGDYYEAKKLESPEISVDVNLQPLFVSYTPKASYKSTDMMVEQIEKETFHNPLPINTKKSR